MDCLSSLLGIVAPCLCNYTTEFAVYIRDLKENVETLRNAAGELNNLCRDVTRQVELDEQQQRKRTDEVAGWLVQVEKMLEEVDEILEKGNEEIQKRCLKCCPGWNCWSSYKTGKTISEKLISVSDLEKKGRFNVVSYMLPPARWEEIPMEETVGSGELYQTVCSHLRDENVGIIGLYGMGGVGKTTLLKKINNDFLSGSNDFDVVIWVVVSKPANLKKVQEAVRSKLPISNETWEKRISVEEKAAEILKVLRTKKFVLLLDDIWEPLNLLEVGIPPAGIENKSKVVFTTRSEKICSQMKAQKLFKVQCLSPKAAWDLFQKEVGNDILKSHPEIPGLAKEVAEECKGLPLALVTIGQAMRSMKGPSDWEKAKSYLSSSGVEDELFFRLKFSYDRLPDDIKPCFIYCSILPEDHVIRHDELVHLWMGEGLLGKVNNIHEARTRGDAFIRDLKLACLLESSDEDGIGIRMHDVIRDMAIWIYHDCQDRKNKIFVYRGAVWLNEREEVWGWNEAERMSFWETSFEEFPQTEMIPNLKTLLVRKCNELRAFPNGFFQHLPLMRVLDLSGNKKLKKLPPGIDNLQALEYLNLSDTRIAELPLELSNLKKLVSLFLDKTRSLAIIPPGVLSSLSSLQLISMLGSRYSAVMKHDFLEELQHSDRLNEISIQLQNPVLVDKLNSSPQLGRRVRFLLCADCSGLTALELSSFRRRIKTLCLIHCADLEKVSKLTMHQWFENLNEVFIFGCPKILDLTWLIYASKLELLTVINCDALKEVIRGDCEVSDVKKIFSRLKCLNLWNSRKLRSIYPHALPFPSLQVIDVYDCGLLGSLPFDSNSARKSLKSIKGDKSWWEDLQWQDESIKNIFNPFLPWKDCNSVAETESKGLQLGSRDRIHGEPPYLTQSLAPQYYGGRYLSYIEGVRGSPNDYYRQYLFYTQVVQSREFVSKSSSSHVIFCYGRPKCGRRG